MAIQSSRILSQGLPPATENHEVFGKQFPIYYRVLVETEHLTIGHQVIANGSILSDHPSYKVSSDSSDPSYGENDTYKIRSKKVQRAQVNFTNR